MQKVSYMTFLTNLHAKIYVYIFVQSLFAQLKFKKHSVVHWCKLVAVVYSLHISFPYYYWMF